MQDVSSDNDINEHKPAIMVDNMGSKLSWLKHETTLFVRDHTIR